MPLDAATVKNNMCLGIHFAKKKNSNKNQGILTTLILFEILMQCFAHTKTFLNVLHLIITEDFDARVVK